MWIPPRDQWMGTHVSISLVIQYLARECERCLVVSHAAISALMEAACIPLSLVCGYFVLFFVSYVLFV